MKITDTIRLADLGITLDDGHLWWRSADGVSVSLSFANHDAILQDIFQAGQITGERYLQDRIKELLGVAR